MTRWVHREFMLRLRHYLLLVGIVGTFAVVAATRPVNASDLVRLYRLALARDSTLQAAMYQRDAAVVTGRKSMSSFEELLLRANPRKS